jgi:hypothetical protein
LPTGTLRRTINKSFSTYSKSLNPRKTVQLIKRKSTRFSTDNTPEIPTAKKYNMVRTLHPNSFMYKIFASFNAHRQVPPFEQDLLGEYSKQLQEKNQNLINRIIWQRFTQTIFITIMYG